MAQVCFDSTAFYTIMIICVAVIVYTLVTDKPGTPAPITFISSPTTPTTTPTTNRHTGDLVRLIHPLIPPVRRDGYHLNFGIPTRGPYGPHHAMGFLHNASDPEQAMPLIGRRIHSNRYEYYTFHHSNPTIKIPIKENKELVDGATISLQSYPGVTFNVSLYDTDQPVYSPYL
jgi:hypothetical protein